MEDLYPFDNDLSNFDHSDLDGFELNGILSNDSTFGLSSAYSSGFDSDHPMPTYDELRNAGFSDYLANQILYGGTHCYSQKELYEALYSDDPLSAYNDMMNSKVNDALERSDKLIEDIQNEFGI